MSDPNLRDDETAAGTSEVDSTSEGESSTSPSSDRSRARSRRRPARSSGLTAAQARKAVRVVANLRDADEQTVDVAAAISGAAGVDRDELAVAVLTGKVKTTRALSDLSKIADADLMEAAVVAGMLPKPRLKDTWELLRATGSALPIDLPDADVKAAIAVARAVHDRDVDQVEALERAAGLLAE